MHENEVGILKSELATDSLVSHMASYYLFAVLFSFKNILKTINFF